MQIRKAAAADAEGILDGRHTAFEPYRTRYTPAGFEDTVMNAKTVAERLQSMTLFVAIENGAVVGTIGCAIHDHEGHLRGMAVLPHFQGSGVARRLLEAAEAELREQGCTRVTLDTTGPLQRAAQFYEKCGYQRTGRVNDF